MGGEGIRERTKSLPSGARPLIKCPTTLALGAVDTIQATPPFSCKYFAWSSWLPSTYSSAPKLIAKSRFDALLDSAMTR